MVPPVSEQIASTKGFIEREKKRLVAAEEADECLDALVQGEPFCTRPRSRGGVGSSPSAELLESTRVVERRSRQRVGSPCLEMCERVDTTQVDESSQMMPSTVPATPITSTECEAAPLEGQRVEQRDTSAFAHGEARDLPVTQWEPCAGFSLPSWGPEFLSGTARSPLSLSNRLTALEDDCPGPVVHEMSEGAHETGTTASDTESLGGRATARMDAEDIQIVSRIFSGRRTREATIRGRGWCGIGISTCHQRSTPQLH